MKQDRYLILGLGGSVVLAVAIFWTVRSLGGDRSPAPSDPTLGSENLSVAASENDLGRPAEANLIEAAPQESSTVATIQTTREIAARGDEEHSEPRSAMRLELMEAAFSEVEEAFIDTPDKYTSQVVTLWPSSISVEWICQRFDIKADAANNMFGSIAAISAPYNQQLADGGLEYGRLVEAELRERFRLRNLGAALDPVAAQERPAQENVFFSKTMIAKGGVTVWVDLADKDCPRLSALRKQMDFVSQQRDERIRSYLQGR